MARTRRNTLPRASSPAGVEARQQRRLATHPAKNEFPKGSSVKDTGQTGRAPGSRNPRKVGR